MADRSEYLKQWKKDNLEKYKESQRQWYKNNSEEIKKRRKQYYQNNRKKIRESTNKRITEIRQYTNDYKLSKGCSICGYNKCAAALVFHHNGDKGFNISEAVACGIKLETIKKEIDKCDVLCANCHRALHTKEKGYENLPEN